MLACVSNKLQLLANVPVFHRDFQGGIQKDGSTSRCHYIRIWAPGNRKENKMLEKKMLQSSWSWHGDRSSHRANQCARCAGWDEGASLCLNGGGVTLGKQILRMCQKYVQGEGWNVISSIHICFLLLSDNVQEHVNLISIQIWFKSGQINGIYSNKLSSYLKLRGIFSVKCTKIYNICFQNCCTVRKQNYTTFDNKANIQQVSQGMRRDDCCVCCELQ